MEAIHWIICHAHTEKDQDENADKENRLSALVSNRVNELCRLRGISCEVVNIWGGRNHNPNPNMSSRDEKVLHINKVVSQENKPVICLEIHWNGQNASPGTCILHHATSAGSKKVAHTFYKEIVPNLGMGTHYSGVIPFPSPYNEKTLQFLSQTACRAVIVEVDTIRHYEKYLWDPGLLEKVAQSIVKGIEKVHWGEL